MTETFSSNSTISHYRIVSRIGAGGMGEVYLAEDIELERQVALKVLLPEIAADQDRVRRFIQEAKAASALNHPNILTVHEIGSFDDSRFIATELIKGATLRDRLKNEPFTLRETLDIALQIAAALNAAHGAGIVHRDIKPENVMLRDDGLVKVLDFGLAKLTRSDGIPATNSEASEEAQTRVRHQTRPGVVMGTVSYMSPEQTRGLQIDSRSDVWSLGVVLYEMLTRETPFAAETMNDSIASILTKEPAPLDGKTPPELQRIIRKSLQKKADERYQTVKDFQLDLQNLKRELEFSEELERSQIPSSNKSANVSTSQLPENATAIQQAGLATQQSLTSHPSSAEFLIGELKNHKRTVGVVLAALLLAAAAFAYWFLASRSVSKTNIQSIAVMPFINEGGNADIEYLSDGMTETLITSLSQVPNLNVKARSSVFRYKGKETDAKTVGKELNVQAILNGRVAQRGDQLTLNLELVDVQTENVIWSEQYNRKQTDLVSLQSDIARDVSSKLKIKLSGAEEQKLTKNYTQNADAYKLYLQGRFYANKRTPKDSRKAIDCFQQAVSIDPNYAIAYAVMGISYAYLTIYGDQPASETFPKAREFSLKAIQLDSNLAEPHILLGLLKFLQDHDPDGWERESQLALAANPNSTDAHRLNGLRLMFLGRFDEALAEERRALEIEPLSTAGNINYSYALFYSGRFDESEAQSRKAIELAPDFWLSHYYLYNVYRFKGNYALAIEELAKSKELRDETEPAKLIRESFAKGGWQGFLRAVTAAPAPMKMTAYNMAGFYAEVGDKDRAFAALNEAIDKADQFIGFMKIDPFMKPLHDDPRFQQVLKRAGFPN